MSLKFAFCTSVFICLFKKYKENFLFRNTTKDSNQKIMIYLNAFILFSIDSHIRNVNYIASCIARGPPGADREAPGAEEAVPRGALHALYSGLRELNSLERHQYDVETGRSDLVAQRSSRVFRHLSD